MAYIRVVFESIGVDWIAEGEVGAAPLARHQLRAKSFDEIAALAKLALDAHATARKASPTRIPEAPAIQAPQPLTPVSRRVMARRRAEARDVPARESSDDSALVAAVAAFNTTVL